MDKREKSIFLAELLEHMSDTRPGEVNGHAARFFTFMRQVQGAVVAAFVIASATWAYSINNRLISIETKIDSPEYTLPGTVSLALYNNEVKALHQRHTGLSIRIDGVDKRIELLEGRMNRLHE